VGDILVGPLLVAFSSFIPCDRHPSLLHSTSMNRKSGVGGLRNGPPDLRSPEGLAVERRALGARQVAGLCSVRRCMVAQRRAAKPPGPTWFVVRRAPRLGSMALPNETPARSDASRLTSFRTSFGPIRWGFSDRVPHPCAFRAVSARRPREADLRLVKSLSRVAYDEVYRSAGCASC